MFENYKISLVTITALLFLLPIFFIPGGIWALDVAKSTFLSLAAVVIGLSFLFELWQKKEVSIPYNPFLIPVVLLPIIYLISALSSASFSVSLFGYNLEIGTFGYIFIVSTILVIGSIIFTDTARVLKTIFALLGSLSLIALFAAIKIFSGGAPILGIFFSPTDSPVGGWTDLAVILGLLSILSTLAIGIMPMSRYLLIIFYIVLGLSTVLLTIINFSTAFIFILAISILVAIYFITVEKRLSSTASSSSDNSIRYRIFLPIILAIISLILLINPTISKTRGTLGDVITNTFNITNIEVRPSLSATFNVSKAVLSDGAILGSGPNTFSHDWLIHKPREVNTTPFWRTAFPFGVGFIPTQISSTGIIGTLLWVAFILLLIFLIIRAWAKMPESRAIRFTLVSYLMATVYLWFAAIMYTPSLTILTLAFICSGLLIAVCSQTEIISYRVISFSKNSATNAISRFLIIVLSAAFLFVGFVSITKTISSFYYKKAIDSSTTQGVSLADLEYYLNKAIKFAPADIHYAALARVYFSMAQEASANTTRPNEENQKIFQESVRKNIEAAQKAISINPSGYQNWVALGMIYSALVPAPLSVNGAYENSKIAYEEALKRNPLNPEILLLLAQLELSKGDTTSARSFIRESIALKEDYIDAYLMLVQLEIQQNNIREAIASAERAATLVPNNPGIHFELGLLKYSNRDYRGAINAFNQALTSTPDYANAKYYLGLSLARLNRLEEARVHFEELYISNPDNADVKQILEKLRAGQSPL